MCEWVSTNMRLPCGKESRTINHLQSLSKRQATVEGKTGAINLLVWGNNFLGNNKHAPLMGIDLQVASPLLDATGFSHSFDTIVSCY